MADWSRDKTEEQKKGPEPHPDCGANVNEFSRIIKSAWMPNSDFEIDTPEGKSFGNFKISDITIDTVFDPQLNKHVSTERVKEYKNVTFVWGKRYRFKDSRSISFHQPRKEFSDELIGTLNTIKKTLG